MVPGWSEAGNIVIYGFSDISPYRDFQSRYQSVLMPYPLVRPFLEDQLSGGDPGLKLIVLDATGPSESPLNVTTMQCVLDSLRGKRSMTAISNSLEWRDALQAYGLNEAVC
jgi:hypothetical protein